MALLADMYLHSSSLCCRQKLVENPEWLATAEAKRQEVMARVLGSDKPAAQVRAPHLMELIASHADGADEPLGTVERL